MTDRDPAYDAADRAFDAHDGPWWNNDSAVLAAREALAPIREWWESGNGTNYDDLLPLIYADEELSDD